MYELITKVCKKCGIEKPLDEFYGCKNCKDSHTNKCKECLREEQNQRRQYNPEYYKKYYKEHPEKFKARNNNPEYHRQWREKNKEHLKQYTESRKNRKKELSRIQYLKDKENGKKKLQRIKYKNTPNGKFRNKIHKHNRRVKQREVKNTLTLKQWNKILEQQNNCCNICGCKFTKDNPPTQDHILPLSKGYGLTFENTQALCVMCNSKKSDNLLPNLIQTWVGVPQ